MGNAQFSIVDDVDSLFYNPAGLARAKGVTWTILGAEIGVGADAVSKAQEIIDSSAGQQFADLVNEFYGEQVYLGANGKMAITMPLFSFAVYNNTYASLNIDNPVYPALATRFINDYVYAAGVGIPLTPFLHVGMTGRRVKRSGVEKVFRASNMTNLDPEDIVSEFTQYGVGYGLDLGANFMIDAPIVDFIFSGVWQNVGDTTFKSENGSRIPKERSAMGLGLGAIVDLPGVTIAPALDVTYLNREDIQLMRKFNFGVEVGLPLLDLRAGFNQGYYTLGAGVGLGPLEVAAATYGVELGEYPGQIEDRRYMVEIKLELGIGSFSFAGKSSDSASKSGSIWGGKRLKQRR